MQDFFKKATTLFIALMFFLVPVFFSHILKALGVPIIFGDSSYERVKVELFYGLLMIIIPAWMISPFSRKIREYVQDKKIVFEILIFLVILSVSTILSPDIFTALFGGIEKRHGAILFLALWIFVLILKTLPENNRIFFIKISFTSLACILFYATVQWLGFDQLGSQYSLGFSGNRAFSTLGNPNYLAGYLILFLPLVATIFKTRTMGAFWYGFILFGVVITGSLSGIIIAIGYGTVRILLGHQGKGGRAFLIIAIILSVIVIPSVVPSEKIGSMEHRTIIWETSLRMVSVSPKRLFFGYGLEQFKTQFPLFVNEKDSRYFTDNTPDRAHNIFLDILFSFGLVGLAFFLTLMVGFFRRNPLSSEKSHVTILFLLFFSFNIPVLVHFLMMGLTVSLKD